MRPIVETPALLLSAYIPPMYFKSVFLRGSLCLLVFGVTYICALWLWPLVFGSKRNSLLNTFTTEPSYWPLCGIASSVLTIWSFEASPHNAERGSTGCYRTFFISRITQQWTLHAALPTTPCLLVHSGKLTVGAATSFLVVLCFIRESLLLTL